VRTSAFFPSVVLVDIFCVFYVLHTRADGYFCLLCFRYSSDPSTGVREATRSSGKKDVRWRLWKRRSFMCTYCMRVQSTRRCLRCSMCVCGFL